LGEIGIVQKSKFKEGMGVGNLKDINIGLLTKWLWRFTEERENWWRKLLCEKYHLNELELYWDLDKGRNGSHFMRSIHKILNTETKYNRVVKEGFRLALGNGEFIKFGEDVWLTNEKLHLLFPRMYALAREKLARIKDLCRWVDKFWVWDIRLGMSVLGWEEQQ